MRLIIDGDACPAKNEVISLANEYGVEPILITSVSHYSEYNQCTYIVVDNRPQAADMEIINMARREDLVISGDYGLAALLLKKGADVVSPRGRVYREEKIDELLMRRHISQKIRRAGGRHKGPSKYTKDDKEKLLSILKKYFRRKNEIFDENI